MKRALTLLMVLLLAGLMHIAPVMAATNQGLEWGIAADASIDYEMYVDAPDIAYDGGIYMEYNAPAPIIPDSITDWLDIPYFDVDIFYANGTGMGITALILLAAYNLHVPIGNWTFLSELAEGTIDVTNFVLDDEDPYFWGYSWEDDDWEFAMPGLRLTVHVDYLKIDGCLSHYTMETTNITTEEKTGELSLERMDIEQYTDRTLPTLDHPADISYGVGETGNSITWNPSDEHPVSYEVLLDGTLVKAGDWNSTSDQVTVLVDGLATGAYNYTIIVTDIAGNIATDEVIVSVVMMPDLLTWALLLGGAAIIIIVIVIIRKRR